MYVEPLQAPEADVPKPKLARTLLAIAVVALLVGAAVAVISRPTKTSPDKELASVRSFVGNARTAHVVTDQVDTYGQPTGPGSTSTDRYHSEGDLRLPDDGHFIEEDGTTFTETIVLKSGFYSRDADKRDQLASKGWIYDSPGSGGIGMATGSASAGAGPGLSGSFSTNSPVGTALGAAGATFEQVMSSGAAMGIPHVLAALKDPVRVETHVIRATLDQDLLMKSFGMTDAQIAEMKSPSYSGTPNDVKTTVTVTITSGPNGRLDRVLWKSVDTSASDPSNNGTSTDDSVFSNWDRAVRIDIPTPDKIDLTPSVDEQAIAAVRDIALVAPRSLPGGFQLTSSTVTEADNADNEECRSVNLTFSDPAIEQSAFATPPDATKPGSFSMPDIPSIDFTEMSPTCKYAPKLEGQAFSAGGVHGFVVPADQATWGMGLPIAKGKQATDVVLQVGNTLIEVAATVTPDQLKAALASLAPLDLATIPIAKSAPPG